MLEPLLDLATRLLDPRGEVRRREQASRRLVALDHLLGDRVLVDLGGPVGDAHDRGHRPHAQQGHLIRHAERPVCVHGPVDDVDEEFRRRHLHASDVLADAGVALLPNATLNV